MKESCGSGKVGGDQIRFFLLKVTVDFGWFRLGVRLGLSLYLGGAEKSK